MTPDAEVSRPVGIEYLGNYSSMNAFLRTQVEHLVVADALWLLECIDLQKLLRMLEGDAYRYWHDDRGRVFRERLAPPASSA